MIWCQCFDDRQMMTIMELNQFSSLVFKRKYWYEFQLLKNNKKINQSEDNNSFKINIKNNILKKHLTAQIFFFFFFQKTHSFSFSNPHSSSFLQTGTLGRWSCCPVFGIFLLELILTLLFLLLIFVFGLSQVLDFQPSFSHWVKLACSHPLCFNILF